MTADRDDLDAILAKHHYLPLSYLGECRCGNWQGPRDLHRAHVAQMVLESDWLRGVKAEARAKELRDWADELDKPPYDLWDRAAIPRLRDLADRVDAEDGGR